MFKFNVDITEKLLQRPVDGRDSREMGGHDDDDDRGGLEMQMRLEPYVCFFFYLCFFSTNIYLQYT